MLDIPLRAAARHVVFAAFVGACVGGAAAAPADVGTYAQLHAFVGTDGKAPDSTLAMGSDGQFYGTALGGGAHADGVIFRVATDGTVTRVYSFTDTGDGYEPHDGLVLGPDGRLYGTTSGGGAGGAGIVYAFSSKGVLTVLHNFHDGADPGANPWAAPIFGPDGALYGTTSYGGSAEAGVVWRLAPDGTYRILWDFAASTDPRSPVARLIIGSDGRLYGTSQYGGALGGGTVFRLALDGSAHQVIHSFDPAGIKNPEAPVVQGRNGRLVGTATYGGTLDDPNGEGCGGVFTMTMTGGGYRELARFSRAAGDPRNPVAALVESDRDGVFYGTSSAGGSHDGGTVFGIRARDGAFRIASTFTLLDGDGWDPRGALTKTPAGDYLGTTFYGGIPRGYGDGTVYRWTP